MSYVDNTLMKGEVVLYRTKPHWIVFYRPAAFLVASILLFIFGSAIPGASGAVLGKIPFYAAMALVALIAAVFLTVAAYVFFQTSEYAITNKRVLMKEGFISRLALEIFLSKVESVKVDQNVPGRLLGYGSVTISGIGGSKDPFTNIPDPLEFRRRVQEQLELLTDLKRAN